MENKKFTADQQAAIDSNANHILVSAAAGSGKTAVLTQRILRHIHDGLDLDRLLVMTYTDAASAEMRERISDALHKGQSTQDYMLYRKQAHLLPLADISTIHAFCKKLVQDHFYLVDVDPAFKIGDVAELSVIKKTVMDDLFEAEYAKEDNPAFLDLIEVFGGKALDDRLDDLIRKIHVFLESDPFPLDAACRYAAYFDGTHHALDDTIWVRAIRDELALGLSNIKHGLYRAIALCHLAEGPLKYLNQFEDDLTVVDELISVLDQPFERMYDAFACIQWGKLPGITQKDLVDPELKDKAKSIRDNVVKKGMTKLVEGVFFAPPGKMKSDLNNLAPRVQELLRVTMAYAKNFTQAKKDRNILDFSDLEHYAIHILHPDGSHVPGAIANDLKARYHEVLIDEYQDSNMIQEMIINAVSDRLFMVGDVKQSIYRFRRANPKLFLQKYRTFTPYRSITSNAHHDADQVRIDLSSNFRSRPEVLAFVNFFFSQLMCEQVGDVAYDHAAALHPGRDEYPDVNSSKKMMIKLLDTKKTEHDADDDDAVIDAAETTDVSTEETEEDLDHVIAETRLIAQTIHDLVGTYVVQASDGPRPCEYKDIAVIARSVRAIAPIMVDELKRFNIPAIADISSDFFEQHEIKVAMAFLHIIDNPRQDIPLAAVLRSPVYGLSQDDLLIISMYQHEHDVGDELFYDRLIAYAQHEHNALSEKLNNMLSQLARWREKAHYLSVSRLLSLLYDETQYPAYVMNMPGGVTRQANLRLLIEHAFVFENSSLSGLYQFVLFLERMNASDDGIPSAFEVDTTRNAVSIMTIHKSKGLEFPVVICAFLGKQFNTQDMKKPVLMHSEYGLASYFVDTEQRTRANTLARFALTRAMMHETISEELRCLYVAMTRAEALLILTGKHKDLEKALKNAADVKDSETLLPVYYRATAQSYLDWILPCIVSGGDALFDLEIVTLGQMSAMSAPAVLQSQKSSPDEKLDFVLEPMEKLPSLPSKLSITEIKRLHQTDITADSTIIDTSGPKFDLPLFYKKQEGVTAMRLGTLLHTVAERLDFHRDCTVDAVDALIDTLVFQGHFTEEDADAIDRNVMLNLVSSEIGARIRASKNVQREVSFVLSIPADAYFTDVPESASGTPILVHGIIDCFFEEANELVIIDYKSDRWTRGMTADEWVQPHKVQLSVYKKALEASTQMPVKQVLLYSFAKAIAIPICADEL